MWRPPRGRSSHRHATRSTRSTDDIWARLAAFSRASVIIRRNPLPPRKPGRPDICSATPHKSDYGLRLRSDEHTSELQSLMRISYAVFCLKKTPPHKLQYLNRVNINTYLPITLQL